MLCTTHVLASGFIDDLRRAQSRNPRDRERIEFASRAIHAWKPSDGDALLAEAYYQRAQGHFYAFADESAEADLTKTIALDSLHQKALLLRGQTRLRSGKSVPAENDLRDYTLLKPDDGEGWLALSEALISRGLPSADKPALEALDQASSRMSKNDFRLFVAEGRAHLAAGRSQKALASFDQSVKTTAAAPQTLIWRAQALIALGRIPEARVDLDAAIDGLEDSLEALRRAHSAPQAIANAQSDLAATRQKIKDISSTPNAH
jgi:tetratricopeptide (TPR) repeat protein